MFSTPSLTPLSLKLDYSDFAAELLWDKMNILQQKNPGQINNDVISALLSIKNC